MALECSVFYYWILVPVLWSNIVRVKLDHREVKWLVWVANLAFEARQLIPEYVCVCACMWACACAHNHTHTHNFSHCAVLLTKCVSGMRGWERAKFPSSLHRMSWHLRNICKEQTDPLSLAIDSSPGYRQSWLEIRSDGCGRRLWLLLSEIQVTSNKAWTQWLSLQ